VAKAEAQLRVESRAHPADRALALYGVGGCSLAERRVVVEGQRVVAIRFGRLALVVGYVDPGACAPSELERCRGDRLWLRREARRHERVLERVCGQEAVVPIPLLTVYPGLDALEAIARERYARWSRSLARLAGKSELGIYVFGGPHAVPEIEPPLAREGGRNSRTGPRARPDPTPLETHVRALWDACARSSNAIRRIDGDGVRGYVLGIAVLVGEAESSDLRKELEQLAPAGQSLGLSTYFEGPRLPFSFV
jgi:hypothetical protein